MGINASPCFVKTSRAREHLEQLKAAREELSHGNYLHGELQRDGRDVVGRLRIQASPPPRIPCIVGDAIHNVRSALDHLACLAVEFGGGRVTRWTQFPIFDHEAGFRRAVLRQLAGAPREFLEFVEKVQPYQAVKNTENPLHVINRLDIKDKHRQLLVSAVLPFHVDLGVEPPDAIEPPLFPAALAFPLVDGIEIVRFRLRFGYEIIRPPVTVKLGADLALVEESPVHGQPVVPLLYDLIKFVESDVLYAAELATS
jgi:hypothetical protein